MSRSTEEQDSAKSRGFLPVNTVHLGDRPRQQVLLPI